MNYFFLVIILETMKRASSTEESKPAAKRQKVDLPTLLRYGKFDEVVTFLSNTRRRKIRCSFPLTTPEELVEMFAKTDGHPDRWILALAFVASFWCKEFPQNLIQCIEEAKDFTRFVPFCIKLQLIHDRQLIAILATIQGEGRKLLEEAKFIVPFDKVIPLLVEKNLPFFPTFEQLGDILSIGKRALPLILQHRTHFLEHTNWTIQRWCLLVVAGVVDRETAFSHIRNLPNEQLWGSHDDMEAFYEVYLPIIPQFINQLKKNQNLLFPYMAGLGQIIGNILLSYDKNMIEQVVWWHRNVQELSLIRKTTNSFAIQELLDTAQSSGEVIEILSRCQFLPRTAVRLQPEKKALLDDAQDEIRNKMTSMFELRSPALLTFIFFGINTSGSKNLNFFLSRVIAFFHGNPNFGRFPIDLKKTVVFYMSILKKMIEESWWAMWLFTKTKKPTVTLFATFPDNSREEVVVHLTSFSCCFPTIPVGEITYPVHLHWHLNNVLYLRQSALPPQVKEHFLQHSVEHKKEYLFVLLHFFHSMKQRMFPMADVKKMFAELPEEWQQFILTTPPPNFLLDLQRSLLFISQEEMAEKELTKIQEESEQSGEDKRTFCEKQIERFRIIQCTQCNRLVPCKYVKYSCCRGDEQAFFCSECMYTRSPCKNCKLHHISFCIMLPRDYNRITLKRLFYNL